MNPLDMACDALEKEASARGRKLRARQANEQEMWNTWNTTGRKPEQLKPLLKSLDPFLNRQMSVYQHRLRDIPPDVIRAEFQDRLVDGIASYDPNRGAKLNTHLNYQLLRAKRFVRTYQNPARIVEPRMRGITPLKAAEERLSERLKRSPTVGELSTHMRQQTKDPFWTPKQVTALRTELRQARPTGQLSADPSTMSPSRQIMRLLPYELGKDEKAVFHRVYGSGGHRPMGTNEIAKQLGMSAPKVSRIKRRVAKKWSTYNE
jgi:DNA-directed RNA polymerase specialized sigma subunit